MDRHIRLSVAALPPPQDAPEWTRLKPETLVDKVVEAVIAQAARGAILPGDRIVEADLARKLGVSRVPVREALRLLESHGIVLNEPYKGIRLRPLTNRWVRDLAQARAALEISAAHSAIDGGRHRGDWLQPMQDAVVEMGRTAKRKDAYGLALADAAFHRELCRLGGNGVVLDLWETLGRQSTILFGLATLGKPMPSIVDEHRDFLRDLACGDKKAIAAALHEHIVAMNGAVDYEAIQEERRQARSRRKSA